jgi:predicted hydrocarbon binding protein
MKIEDISVMDLATDPRPTLGDQVPFFFYRYLSLFAVADSKGGQAQHALFEGGHKIGVQLVKDMMYGDVNAVAQHFEQNGMAHVVLEGGITRLRLEECATCSGLPNVDMALCYFDGGILAGALEQIAKSAEPYGAREIECTGLGHSACVFEIGPRSKIEEEADA